MDSYLYLLQCADGSFFSGITRDLDQCISNFIEGKDPEHYTYSRRPVKLVFYEKMSSEVEDHEQDEMIKKWSRKKKLEILSSKPKNDSQN